MGIRLENVNYVYAAGTAEEKKALDNINLTINDGEFIGLVGHTGSGKSTLTQILNGLEKATSGSVFYNERNIYDKDFKMKELRGNVGLVFQYPEYQLFEETVYKDIAFGPRNMGLDEQEIDRRVRQYRSIRSS